MEKIRNLLKRFLILVIQGYQWVLSPIIGQRCRFYPSCSEYAKNALEEHGILKAFLLSAKRLLRCHPWHSGGFDPVPKKHVKGKN